MHIEKKYENHDLNLKISLGFFAGQADGSVWIERNGTIILATATREKSKDFPGFFPLSVDHREHYASVGRIPGGYHKREGKPSDKEVLTSRIIDRCLRPLFPDNFFDKIHIVTSVYSVNTASLPTDLSLFAASLALYISEIPFLEAAGCCELALINNEWITYPTNEQLTSAKAKIVVAGTYEGINMVEGSSDGISEEELVKAMFIGHEEIKKQVLWQKEIYKQFKEKDNREVLINDQFGVEEWKDISSKYLNNEIIEKIFLNDKVLRTEARDEIWNEFISINNEKIKEKEISLSIIEYAFNFILQEKLTNLIYKNKKRVDGRDFETVRPLKILTNLLPMNHGSGLFMRGRTQVLVSTTLGGGDDESRIENILDTPLTTFMLHYNFLPFSVGEARPLRSIGRREVGHGYLAQNAIKAILPENKNFPYTIRLVADVLESDGSSSMATVCGSMMSLMDAGVPVKDMVAGIAMGMISGENKEFEILTDIAGIEDELGLMDFKVAGTKDNVTAIQMDIKYKGGLPREIFIKALEKAKIARLHIMEAMKKVMDKPNTSLSSLVPQFATINIPKDKIGSVIGSGGKTIREITEKTETSINIEDTGLVKIFGKPGENFNKAISWIKMIVGEVVIGTSFNNATIKKITEFGLFVELFPNFDGLVHISSIPKQEQDSIKNNYREGDKIKVVVIDYDPITSRIRLKIVK